MDELNLNPESIEGQDPVVEGQVAEDGVQGATPPAEQQEVTGPVRQTREDNSQFAAARREAEAQAREAQRVAEEQQAINERLMGAIRTFGYQGSDPMEVADMLESQARNIPIEQIRTERQQLEDRAKKLKDADPEVQQMRQQLEQYKQNEMNRLFQDDLKAIRKQHPGEKAKDIMELGEAFIAARSMGVDPLAAYDIAMTAKGRNTPPKPPETPTIGKSTGKEKEYYSPDEVDKLTNQELSDPKVLARVQKSMTKWK